MLSDSGGGGVYWHGGGGVRFCRERRVKYGKEHDYEADEEADGDVDWMSDDCGFVGVLQLSRAHEGQRRAICLRPASVLLHGQGLVGGVA